MLTLEQANQILSNKDNVLEAIPFDQALLKLIKDLQVRHVELLRRVEQLEKGATDAKIEG